jgi:hypothetical protein
MRIRAEVNPTDNQANIAKGLVNEKNFVKKAITAMRSFDYLLTLMYMFTNTNQEIVN